MEKLTNMTIGPDEAVLIPDEQASCHQQVDEKSIRLSRELSVPEPFEKEQAIGFMYQRIFTKTIKNSTVDIVLLELEPDATRPMVVTEAFEYKYILSGKVEYIFEDQQYSLSEGDSMLFDGRLLHTPKNLTDQKAIMLIIYFFEQNGNNTIGN